MEIYTNLVQGIVRRLEKEEQANRILLQQLSEGCHVVLDEFSKNVTSRIAHEATKLVGIITKNHEILSNEREHMTRTTEGSDAPLNQSIDEEIVALYAQEQAIMDALDMS